MKIKLFENILNFLIFIVLFNFINMQITGAKKISFINNFIEEKNDLNKFKAKYISFITQITKDNVFNFEIINEYLDKNSDMILQFNTNLMPVIRSNNEINPEKTEFKIFSIMNSFIISTKNLAKSSYYDEIFSKIKNPSDALAIFILHELDKGGSSNFVNFFKNLPISSELSTPLLYDQTSISYFSGLDIHDKLQKELNQYKKSYNDLRRFIYSYGDEFRNDFIGSFLYGDYLWALYIVNSHSLKVGEEIYLIPGTEYLTLFGMYNLHRDIDRCCYSYALRPSKYGDKYTDLIAVFSSEEPIELFDKFATTKIGIFNPKINNEELFLSYGIVNTNRNYDLLYLPISDVISLKNISKDEEFDSNKLYTNNTVIRLSCNDFDLRDYNYFLQAVSPKWAVKNNQEIIKYLAGKLMSIIQVFKQEFNKKENLKEVTRFGSFLKRRFEFIESLTKCLKALKFEPFTDDKKEQEINSNSNKAKTEL
jgi:hypothetical protein